MIRHAVPSDADAIERVRLRAWEEVFRDIGTEEAYERASSREQVERTRTYLADLPKRHSVVVAEHRDTIVGFARSGPPRDNDVHGKTTREVYTLYVDPGWWRRGLGRALAAAALDHLRGEGYAEAVLWAFESHAPPRAFYEATGWRLDGKRSEFAGAETVRYRRRL